jgi:hypothetical protein
MAALTSLKMNVMVLLPAPTCILKLDKMISGMMRIPFDVGIEGLSSFFCHWCGIWIPLLMVRLVNKSDFGQFNAQDSKKDSFSDGKGYDQ